jgi:hypothetical protein
MVERNMCNAVMRGIVFTRGREHDRDGRCRLFCREDWRGSLCDNHSDLEPGELGRDLGVVALDRTGGRAQKPNDRQLYRLLRACRERPRGCAPLSSVMNSRRFRRAKNSVSL